MSLDARELVLGKQKRQRWNSIPVEAYCLSMFIVDFSLVWTLNSYP